MMRAYGYEKPIVAGDHGGPVPFRFPMAEAAAHATLASAFAEAPATQSTDELKARATQESPERRPSWTTRATLSATVIPPRTRSPCCASSSPGSSRSPVLPVFVTP